MPGVTDRFAVLFRALRVLRRIVLWGVLALFALLVAALAINAFDEPLSPEALVLRQPPANRYSPDENIYLALAGFDAPQGQSVVAVGQAKVAHYNERVDSLLRDPQVGLEMLTAADPEGLKFRGSVDFGRPPELSFWGNVRANGAEIERLVNQNRELYERYLALFALPGYYETTRPSYAAPIFLAPTEVRSLFLANVSLRLQRVDDTQTQAALNSLRQDVALWRRVLTGEGTLISKMVAVSFLQTDSLILSDMIADPGAAIPRNMGEFLPEFDLNQWSISNVFADEFRRHAFLYRQTQALIDNHWQPPESAASRAWRMWNKILNPIGGQFFKINATENLDARKMNELAGFAVMDPTTFSPNQARMRKWVQDNSNFLSIRSIYNPIGKILVAIAAPAYKNYALRPYDAAALQRLVRLSFEIRRQQISPSAIPAFMKLHPEWSTHPADGRPFVWKSTASEIAIQPVAQQPADRRFSVQIWKQSH